VANELRVDGATVVVDAADADVSTGLPSDWPEQSVATAIAVTSRAIAAGRMAVPSRPTDGDDANVAVCTRPVTSRYVDRTVGSSIHSRC
jgi:hypothetical protein